MINKKSIFAVCILSFVFAFPILAQQDKDQVPGKVSAAIAQSNQLYSQGFEKHLPALVTERYSSDGAIMAPGAPAITGQKDFEAFFEGGYAHGIRNVLFQTVRLFGFSGTFVNEEGRYELKNAKGETIDQGKYIVIWKKTASGWKMYRDIFNTNLNSTK